MDHAAETEEARFAAYVGSLAEVIGHADRVGPLRDYCTGLLMPCERKSVEPMAAVLSPSRVSGKHQSLLHFVGQGPWSDAAVLEAVGELVLPAIVEQGPIEAWIVDDTGFAKKGAHSVGVARQYCGRFGKTGELPDRGDAVGRQPGGEPADRLSALSAGRMGERRGAAGEGACARGCVLQAQVGHRARPDPCCARRRRAAGRGARRPGLWLQHRVARRTHRRRSRLRSRGTVERECLAAGDRAATRRSVERTRAAPVAVAARQGSSPGLGQAAGAEPAGARLERGDLAGRIEQAIDLALCRRAGAAVLA